jgi:tRNA(fMet)-specific endonuclease VapC
MTELGLLDTSIVILLGRIQDPATLPDESVISAGTLAELSVGPHVADTEAERIGRQAHLQQAENDFDVIAFDAGAARAFGAVAGALRTAGRKKAARAYDALIAATAISEGASAVHLQSRRLRRHSRVGHARCPTSRCREGVTNIPAL